MSATLQCRIKDTNRPGLGFLSCDNFAFELEHFGNVANVIDVELVFAISVSVLLVSSALCFLCPLPGHFLSGSWRPRPGDEDADALLTWMSGCRMLMMLFLPPVL